MEEKNKINITSDLESDTKKDDLNINNATGEEENQASKRIKELVKQNEKNRKALWLEAKNEYDRKYKEQITVNDIDRLVSGEKPYNEPTRKLQKIRQELLKKKEQELLNKLNENLDEEILSDSKIWNQIKRGFVIGLFTGLPGIFLTTLKDNLDYTKVKKNIVEATKEYAETGNDNNLRKFNDIFQNKFGGILDVKGLTNYILSSDVFTDLKNNNDEIKKIIIEAKEEKEKSKKSLEEVLEEIEIEEENEEEEEEEENPEPVRGMKFM